MFLCGHKYVRSAPMRAIIGRPREIGEGSRIGCDIYGVTVFCGVLRSSRPILPLNSILQPSSHAIKQCYAVGLVCHSIQWYSFSIQFWHIWFVQCASFDADSCWSESAQSRDISVFEERTSEGSKCNPYVCSLACHIIHIQQYGNELLMQQRGCRNIPSDQSVCLSSVCHITLIQLTYVVEGKV